ncbi:MAG: histidinol-phosphatase [Chitinivibrionales bacterium]|nr:histidinol-phosphatase [Chitinivibrionales bacterium]
MLVDYHLHSPYCGHAQGKITEYIQNGINAGLREIGFAEHLYRYYLSKSQRGRHWDWGISAATLERYVNELCELKQFYAGEICIRIGLEIDYVEGAEDLIDPIIGRYPLDFLLGSIHCLPSIGWKHLSNYHPPQTGPLYRDYFALALAAVKSGIFQSLAHIDFIWRYTSLPENQGDFVKAALDNVVKAAAANDTCIEINANAYLWSQAHAGEEGQELFSDLLKAVVRTGVPITMGSDAHSPESVGKALAELAAKLRLVGITKVMTFNQKKRLPVKLG